MKRHFFAIINLFCCATRKSKYFSTCICVENTSIYALNVGRRTSFKIQLGTEKAAKPHSHSRNTNIKFLGLCYLMVTFRGAKQWHPTNCNNWSNCRALPTTHFPFRQANFTVKQLMCAHRYKTAFQLTIAANLSRHSQVFHSSMTLRHTHSCTIHANFSLQNFN